MSSPRERRHDDRPRRRTARRRTRLVCPRLHIRFGNNNIQNVAARRFPIVDEEAGVVLAMAVFIRKPGTTTRRNMFGEWFILENNKIRTIYATLHYPSPEEPVPNWPPYEGNWPLPAAFSPAPTR